MTIIKIGYLVRSSVIEIKDPSSMSPIVYPDLG